MYSFKDLPKFLNNNSPIKLFQNRKISKKFIQFPLQKKYWINVDSEIDIYIVAFNQPSLIEEQIFFLQKFCLDKYRLIIVDNSNDNKQSQKIEGICIKNETNYIKLPENKLKASYSHALALNYIVKNIIQKQQTPYIGFLDHDCFLVKQLSIIPILKKQKIWGHLMNPIKFSVGYYSFNMSGKRRNLWPGCAFYDKKVFNNGFDFFPNKQIFPISFLDTGGGNRQYIYKFYDYKKLNLLKNKKGNILEGTENIGNIFCHLGGAGYRDSNTILELQNNLHNIYF